MLLTDWKVFRGISRLLLPHCYARAISILTCRQRFFLEGM